MLVALKLRLGLDSITKKAILDLIVSAEMLAR